MSKDIQSIEPHRALVLQGGGALGAYEAGAFKAIYDYLTKKRVKMKIPYLTLLQGRLAVL